MARFPPDSVAMTLLLTALIAFGALSNNMYLPSLPSMAEVLGVPVGAVLLTVSAFFLGFAAGQLVYGSLSDRFGRRPVLLGGLAAYTAASAICMAAPGIEVLIAGRVVQGLGAAAGQVLARAIVRDLFEPPRAARMLSVMAAVFSVMPALAPFAGGFLEAWFGWRAQFATMMLIGSAVLALVWRGLGETIARPDPTATDPRRIAANYRALASHPAVMGYTLSFAALFAGMFAFHSGSAFVFIDLLGYGPEVYGAFFIIVGAGYLAGSVASARITVRLGHRRLVVLGGTIAVLGGGVMLALVLAGRVTAWTILVPQFTFMLGTGLLMPNAIVGALAPYPEKAGAASALFGFFQQAAAGLMVAGLGWIADGTARPMAACIFAGAAASLAAYGGMVRRAHGRAEGPAVPGPRQSR